MAATSKDAKIWASLWVADTMVDPEDRSMTAGVLRATISSLLRVITDKWYTSKDEYKQMLLKYPEKK